MKNQVFFFFLLFSVLISLHSQEEIPNPSDNTDSVKQTQVVDIHWRNDFGANRNTPNAKQKP